MPAGQGCVVDIPAVEFAEVEPVVGLVGVLLFVVVLEVVEDEVPELDVEFVPFAVPDPPGVVPVVPVADVPEGEVLEPVEELVPGIGSHATAPLGLVACGVAVLAGGVAVCGVGDAVLAGGVAVCGVGDAV